MSSDSQTSLFSCCGAGREKHYIVLQHSKREGWAAKQFRGESGKFSNSCTVMGLRKHLAHAFHPITQVFLQVEQLFQQRCPPAEFQGDQIPCSLEGTKGQPACHLWSFVQLVLVACLSHCSGLQLTSKALVPSCKPDPIPVAAPWIH